MPKSLLLWFVYPASSRGSELITATYHAGMVLGLPCCYSRGAIFDKRSIPYYPQLCIYSGQVSEDLLCCVLPSVADEIDMILKNSDVQLPDCNCNIRMCVHSFSINLFNLT